MLRQRKIHFFSIIGLALILVTGAWLWGGGSDCTLPPNTMTISPIAKPHNATEISIIYAPEEDAYLQAAIHDFNCSYAKGIDPLTGAQLALSEQPIYVTGRSGSSGTVHQGIINAPLAPNNANVERPTIFSPSVGFWLAMVNEATGQAVFDLRPEQSRPTALSAVVIAIWESRLQAIQQHNGNQPVGWADLRQVMRSPNGWNDYGISGRKTVYYGATNPYVSSTGLAALSSEFYASAEYDAVIQAVEFLQSAQDAEGQNQARIQTIIVLSDGKDTSSTHTLYDITQLNLDKGNPILIFPIAYGSGADIAMLNTLAQLSTTKVFSGDPAHIEEVFAALSSTQ